MGKKNGSNPVHFHQTPKDITFLENWCSQKILKKKYFLKRKSNLLRNLAKNLIKNVLYIRNLAFLRTLDKAVKGFLVRLRPYLQARPGLARTNTLAHYAQSSINEGPNNIDTWMQSE